jgi:plasmid maintenance system killer protein
MKDQTLIIEYADFAIEELITYHKSDDKRYKKLKSNATFLHDLDGVMAILRAATNTSGLSWYKKLNYEPLKYGLSGYSSVRIGFTSKYRLIFEEFDGGIRIKLIEINEHYGDK